jgi:hypothetical protein
MTTNNNITPKINELEERIKKLEDVFSSGRRPNAILGKSKKISAKEFLLTKKAQKDTEKTLALAYYLEFIENMKSFNSSDLESIFRSAKEKLPANINDVVNKIIATRGFLVEAKEKKDDKKAWYLTNTGENYVEHELSEESLNK